MLLSEHPKASSAELLVSRHCNFDVLEGGAHGHYARVWLICKVGCPVGSFLARGGLHCLGLEEVGYGLNGVFFLELVLQNEVLAYLLPDFLLDVFEFALVNKQVTIRYRFLCDMTCILLS